MRVSASSPGKVILFGEHAVVYGEPCLSVAISLRMRVSCKRSETSRLISEITDSPYFKVALKKYSEKVEAEVISQIPPASGLGSSASFSVSLVSCLEKLRGREIKEEEVAKKAFEIEYEAQGKASPNDTSVTTHGRGILISKEPGKELLWRISRGNITWYIHHVEVPRLDLAVVYTGIPSDTAAEVEKVRRRYEREERVREAISEIGELVLLGYDSLIENDLERIGEIMNRNHELLREIGVSNHILDSIVTTLRKYSYGAKLTGAGGGGSVIALIKDEEKLREVIPKEFSLFIVKTGEEGVKIEDIV